MVWYRICGSIAWVGASLDVGLDGFCASMLLLRVVTSLVSSFSLGGIFRSSFDEVSKRGSCAVPWYASYGFSGLLGKGLWSLCSIATVLEQSIANRVCVSSLVARVDGLFSGGFSCLKKW
ncbi:unnamed protein product [Brassica rapa]|uniref:Uncharacterized protein n=2 Tax=Brassica TaxID=3705 RepID=A0A3P5ZKY8_BRACM|nr:unnamed protein product [Brassica rapa]VDC80742.1 unnamed protein product [Brassica rapa]